MFQIKDIKPKNPENLKILETRLEIFNQYKQAASDHKDDPEIKRLNALIDARKSEIRKDMNRMRDLFDNINKKERDVLCFGKNNNPLLPNWAKLHPCIKEDSRHEIIVYYCDEEFLIYVEIQHERDYMTDRHSKRYIGPLILLKGWEKSKIFNYEDNPLLYMTMSEKNNCVIWRLLNSIWSPLN